MLYYLQPMRILLTGFFMVLFYAVSAQSVTRLDGSLVSFTALDAKISELVAAAPVHGLSVTIFNRNEAVYRKTFGYKRADTKEPIRPGTNIYGASLSKAVFAVL